MPRTFYTSLVLVILLSLAGYALYQRGPEESDPVFAIPTIQLTDTSSSTAATLTGLDNRTITGLPPETLPDGSVLYKNPLLRFSLVHTAGFIINEYDEGSGARTITFEDPQSLQEFQIFVIPYSDTQITKERFKMDEPSGVFKEPTEVLIGGTKATMFFSSNSVMGATREVWFIRGGLLYEVTTEKASDAWLAAIMKTWQFI